MLSGSRERVHWQQMGQKGHKDSTIVATMNLYRFYRNLTVVTCFVEAKVNMKDHLAHMGI